MSIADHATGILKNLQEKHTHERRASTFFSKPINFNIAQTVLPVPSDSPGTIVKVRLIVETTYTSWFQDQQERALSLQQENALSCISSFLYSDVIEALYAVQQKIGDGNRSESMALVSELIKHLRGV